MAWIGTVPWNNWVRQRGPCNCCIQNVRAQDKPRQAVAWLAMDRRRNQGPQDFGGQQADYEASVEKKDLYEQFGVPEYWIIDPEAHTIEVFVLGEKGYELHSRAALGETAVSRLLAGFSASWAQLMA
jgi:hypothetical protein